MRWMPLFIILTLSLLSGIYLFNNIREFNRHRVSLISLIYLTFLGTILFTPLSFTGTEVYIMPAGIGSVNLSHITYDLGFIENIALTVPLGFLIKRAFSNISLISMVPVGLMTGAAIETMQYYLSHVFLINRTSDISDVVANGIGIVVGSVLVLVYRYVYEQKLLEKWM
ncbi:VanZ family protein [Companilactobacillus zhachilii]|uniref:VanZ family protein n=1 Tax=Companilactobacillus zhachilii TaxID=2304606 RepID=UPI001921A839|nr:VanZ family protein [Companilactobacillus zhachilii]MBL3529990.1 VanZ family protein [Companilactobacillus zhachilii]